MAIVSDNAILHKGFFNESLAGLKVCGGQGLKDDTENVSSVILNNDRTQNISQQ